MNIAEAFFTLAIVVMAVIIGGKDPLKEPFRVNVCLVASGREAEDVSTNIWSDQIEQYFKRYPGSYCGKCGAEKQCPSD